MTFNRVLVIVAVAIIAIMFASALFGQESDYNLQQRSEYTLASPRGADPLGPYSLDLRLGQKTLDRDALFLEDAFTAEADAVVMIANNFGFVMGGSVAQTETDLEAFRPCESCADIADQTGMDVTVLEGHVGVRAYLTSPQSRVKPYVAGGFGGYRFLSDAEDYDGKSAWELYTGAGIQVQLNRGVALAGNFGFNPMQCELFNRETQADVMSATVGISYSWGGKRPERSTPVVVVETPPAQAELPCRDYPPDILVEAMDGRDWVHFGADVERDPTTLTHLGYYERWSILAERGDRAPFLTLWLEDRCGLLHRYETQQGVQGTTG